MDSAVGHLRQRVHLPQQPSGQNLPWVSSHPQALPRGSFLLSPPTSVVLYAQAYAEQSWGQGKIRPRPCPPEELKTDSLRSACETWEPRGEGSARPRGGVAPGLWRVAGNLVVENAGRDLQEVRAACINVPREPPRAALPRGTSSGGLDSGTQGLSKSVSHPLPRVSDRLTPEQILCRERKAVNHLEPGTCHCVTVCAVTGTLQF